MLNDWRASLARGSTFSSTFRRMGRILTAQNKRRNTGKCQQQIDHQVFLVHLCSVQEKPLTVFAAANIDQTIETDKDGHKWMEQFNVQHKRSIYILKLNSHQMFSAPNEQNFKSWVALDTQFVDWFVEYRPVQLFGNQTSNCVRLSNGANCRKVPRTGRCNHWPDRLVYDTSHSAAVF